MITLCSENTVKTVPQQSACRFTKHISGHAAYLIHSVVAVATYVLFGKWPSFAYMAGIVLYKIGRHLFKQPVEKAKAVPIIWTRDALVKVSQETQSYIDKGFYHTPSGRTKVILKSGVVLSEQSKKYRCQKVERAVEPRFANTKIEVCNRDCLDVAQELVEAGHRTGVLLFSGPESAGGGYEDGLGNGQEENIIIRSDLRGFMKHQDEEIVSDTARAPSEQKALFPIHEDHVIVTPGVTVFRESKANSYALSDKPFQIDIVITAARNLCGPDERARGPYKKIGEDVVYAQKNVESEVELMIKNQLFRGYEAGFEAMVLGPFGCGAFGHPPQSVAKLYKLVIDRYFPCAFKEIVFAILDDRKRGTHNPKGNFEPFLRCFSAGAAV